MTRVAIYGTTLLAVIAGECAALATSISLM
jgi:hypothetical protein